MEQVKTTIDKGTITPSSHKSRNSMLEKTIENHTNTLTNTNESLKDRLSKTISIDVDGEMTNTPIKYSGNELANFSKQNNVFTQRMVFSQCARKRNSKYNINSNTPHTQHNTPRPVQGSWGNLDQIKHEFNPFENKQLSVNEDQDNNKKYQRTSILTKDSICDYANVITTSESP